MGVDNGVTVEGPVKFQALILHDILRQDVDLNAVANQVNHAQSIDVQSNILVAGESNRLHGCHCKRHLDGVIFHYGIRVLKLISAAHHSWLPLAYPVTFLNYDVSLSIQILPQQNVRLHVIAAEGVYVELKLSAHALDVGLHPKQILEHIVFAWHKSLHIIYKIFHQRDADQVQVVGTE
tara:strand:+ start:7316 stop:7852 length:537 start_codon:yes stop_codon:yes gene_type:complete